MNSAAMHVVERQFAGRPVLDIVAAARALARGHASHALALRAQNPRSGLAMRAKQRRIARVEYLSDFWSAVGLYFGVIDLIEEHDGTLPAALAHSLGRFAERQTQNICDPPRLCNPNFDPSYLLPPPEHLPTALPSSLVEAFGALLTAPKRELDWNKQ